MIYDVGSECRSLKEILTGKKYKVDFYQREYVWQKKQLEDLINDLSCAFLNCYSETDQTVNVANYNPYFMGEIVLAGEKEENNKYAIIDGQQRLTTLTLILIYILHTFGTIEGFPDTDVKNAVYSNSFGNKNFVIDIDDRYECMKALFDFGTYEINSEDNQSVCNIVNIYNDIEECWNNEINRNNICHFTYWLLEKVKISEVTTNDSDFAYIIFETMNDRGLSLTPVEMLRSYILANIKEKDDRDNYMNKFDDIISNLSLIKLTSKSKAESEFFKVYFRSHYADNLSQKDNSSDFVRIGSAFHRWIRENNNRLELTNSKMYCDFVDRIKYFSEKYKLIYQYIDERKADKYLYLIVNSDYGFTLQPALILAALTYNDNDNIVEQKIQIVSKFITKLLTWRVWNHNQISQSALESQIYSLCKEIRDKNVSDIENILNNESIELPDLAGLPILNQQNKKKIRTLLALITEIVTIKSGLTSDYMLNKPNIEIEHIWSDHPEEHKDEIEQNSEFSNIRNNIGDLLLLPKSFNASYNDTPYNTKLQQYFSQNILAQTLHQDKYKNNPGFEKYKNKNNLPFKPYGEFKKVNIFERGELYKQILLNNWLN